MKWNAFELIAPALEKTKQRVFPFNFGEWLKLGVSAAISGNLSGNFNFFNFGGGNHSIDKEKISSNITGAASGLKENSGIIGALIAVLVLFMVAWSYVSSIFQFIFIDNLMEKKTIYRWRKNMAKGTSLFLFNFVVALIIMAGFAVILLPYALAWINGTPIIESVGWIYIAFSIFLAIIFLAIVWIFLLFLNDFVTAFMYAKNTPAYYSWKEVWKIIFKNKIEVFIYWLARIVTGIVVAIIALIIFFLAFIVLLIVAGILFLIGYLIYLLAGGAALLIAIGIALGIVLIIVFAILIIAIIVPLPVFAKYFALLNFEQLTKIKIIKRR